MRPSVFPPSCAGMSKSSSFGPGLELSGDRNRELLELRGCRRHGASFCRAKYAPFSHIAIGFVEWTYASTTRNFT